MADVTLNLKNDLLPSADTTSMTVDEDSVLNVPRPTSKTMKKRAGDLEVGDGVLHAGGTFTVDSVGE